MTESMEYGEYGEYKEFEGLARRMGRVVRELRGEANWSQTKLAARADMSVSGLSLIETGKRNLTVTTLERVAEALDMPASELLARAEKEGA